MAEMNGSANTTKHFLAVLLETPVLIEEVHRIGNIIE